MLDQSRWPIAPWVAVLTGFSLLAAASEAGWVLLILALAPSLALVACGLTLGLGHFELRLPQTLAIAGVASALLSLFALPWIGLGTSLLLLIGSIASIVVAGHEAISSEPFAEHVPAPEPSLALAAKVSADEVVLGLEQFSARLPRRDGLIEMREDVDAACGQFEARGFMADAASYHETPTPLTSVSSRLARAGGRDYEHVWFESGYAPRDGEPGRDRYLAHVAPRTAHAWLRVHPGGEDRPWMVCNNGYRLGHAGIDLMIFAELYEKLGLNLLIPVLPLHGPRRIGRMSGDGWFTGHPLDTVHAEAQAQWDIRRLIGWLRAERGASAIGVTGVSLGGYTTALLSGLESGLSCSIPGIPVSDFASIVMRHAPTRQRRALESVGLDEDKLRRVFSVISPLEIEPTVPFDGRLIYAAVSDRLVPPDHAQRLHAHWGEPEILWCQGGHLTTPRERKTRNAVEAMLRHTKLVA